MFRQMYKNQHCSLLRKCTKFNIVHCLKICTKINIVQCLAKCTKIQHDSLFKKCTKINMSRQMYKNVHCLDK